MHIHHHQPGNDRDVTGAIGKEAPTFAQLRDKHSGHRRPNHARPVEHRGIERDGIHQVFLAHHVDQKRLPAGNIERIHHSQERSENENLRHCNSIRQGQRRQHKRQQHRRDLRPDDDMLAVATIGDDATQRRK